MSEGFLIRRGGTGGSAKGVCAIKASWPEGYTCICYSGSKKLKAGKDVTEWIFMLPFSGEWTVEAGDLSETVTVAEGEVKEVTLLGRGYIVNDGTLVTHFQINTSTATYEKVNDYIVFKSTAASSGNGRIYIEASGGGNIDFSEYDRLVFDVEAISPRSGTLDYIDVGILNGSYKRTNIGVNNPLPRQEISFDVSSLTGGKISMFISDNPATVELRIYSIWGEKEKKDELVLWEKGNNNTAATGGWNINTTNTANPNTTATNSTLIIGGYTSNSAAHQYMGTKNKIDFTPYSQLVIDIASHSGQALTIGPSSQSGEYGGFVASLTPSANGVYTLDVNKINTSYYLNMRHENNTVKSASVSFNSIKLVK